VSQDVHSLAGFGDVELARALLLRVAGLDRTDEQQDETPMRFVKALRELTTSEPYNFTTFKVNVDEMVIVKDIDFATLCKHHVLPFMGTAHVGYVSNGKIAGISKIPRLVHHLASGLNTQEELTQAIAAVMEAKLEPLGVAVVMEARHMCMQMRGAKSVGVTRTMAVTGVFKDHSRTAKAEFLEGIR
jgi:GTP cyclohydrolase IA